MTHDIYGEKIGIGDQLDETRIEVSFDIKSICRCCGTEMATLEDRRSIGVHVSVDEIKSWFESHNLHLTLIDFFHQGVRSAKDNFGRSTSGEGE